MDEINQEIKAILNMLNYVDANRWKWWSLPKELVMVI